jgi:DNA-binding protein H-NS
MTIKSKELESMSLEEISDLQEKLNAAKTFVINKRGQELREKIAQGVELVLASEGVTLRELYGKNARRIMGHLGLTASTSPKKPEKKKNESQGLAAKYINPNNSKETWTGRGRMPTWLLKAIDDGKKKEDMLAK